MLLRQWSTFQSGPLAPLIWPENRVKCPITCEPVVHFPEWTTGSSDLAGKKVKSPDFVPASGPLSKVDHWLLRFGRETR